MKRSPMPPGSTPLKRTGFLRINRKEAGAVAKLRKGLKTKGPRMTPIRASAKGEECTLRFPGCNFNSETTCWAHSNSHRDGKGMGIKARDEEGCYSCSACHAFLDGGYAGHMDRALVDVNFSIARELSQAILRRKGLIKSEGATDCESVAPSNQKKTEEEIS